MKPAADLASMADLRTAIDQLDRAIVDLLARRADYIDRAIALKPGEAMQARIPERVEQVVANVRARAGQVALDPDLVEMLWRGLIDWSIRREERVLGPAPDQGEKR